jgi:hypothetical protein
MQSCVNFMVEILESRCASQDNHAIVDVSTMFGNLAMVSVLLPRFLLVPHTLKTTLNLTQSFSSYFRTS